MPKIKSLRIVFKCNGQFYKFLSFFSSKSDNSFYFHIYRKTGEKIKLPKIERKDDKTLTISSIDCEESNFDQNKISFHESGYLHTTDKKGNRLRDGKFGIPFHELKNDYLLLLCLSPTHPENMVEIPQPSYQRDFIFEFDPKIGPILVHIWIRDKNCKTHPGQLPGENILGGFVKVEYDGKDFQILMTLTKLNTTKEGAGTWPPFTLALNLMDKESMGSLLRVVEKSF